ncbi:MAG: hypothetical protein ACI965_002418 [Paraglaciecola sp.]|jgi:hypothetical protein
MTVILSEELIALAEMPPEQRFDYAIEQMIESKILWGLFGKNGWLMLKAEDDACVPVWPHEEFAAAWVKDEFPDCEPKPIAFTDWLGQWLPGMKNNGTLVLVFPLGDDEEGIMLEAQEMMDCIEEDLQGLSAP